MKASEYLMNEEVIYENNGFKIGLDGDSNATEIINKLDNRFVDKDEIKKNLIELFVSHRRIMEFPQTKYHDMEGRILQSLAEQLSTGVNICNVSREEIAGTLRDYNILISEDMESIDSVFGIKIERIRLMIDWFAIHGLKPADAEFEKELKLRKIV